MYMPVHTGTYLDVLVGTNTYHHQECKYWIDCEIGFRGTNRNEAMPPGLSETYVPALESVLDVDLDPDTCEEDEEFFKSLRQ